MGFRCPLCLKDFLRDKKAWEEHCSKAHEGLGEDVVNLVKNITKGKKGKSHELSTT